MAVNEEKLVEMLKYVSEHNDFYKNRIKEYGITNPLDITQWPVLTRKELQENRYNMFSDGYKSKYFNQQLHRQFSSGSSGIPVNVYWDRNDWCRSNTYLWRKRFELHNIRPSDKYVIFTLNAFNIQYKKDNPLFVNQPANVLIVNFSLVHNKEDEINVVKIIEKFNPVWLYVQPSILDRLILTFKNQSIPMPSDLQYIEFVGEILTKDVRRRTKEFFGVNIANLYGAEEFNGIAYESQGNNMEILSDNVYIEILMKNSLYSVGTGESVITSLTNYAMPLIRYNIQDVISLKETNISERQNKYITNIIGRSHKVINANGMQINTFMLAEIISEVNNELYDPIKGFKYVFYYNINQLNCYILIFEYFNNWAEVIKTLILTKLTKKIEVKEPIKFNVEIVSSLPNEYGKHSILEIE